MEEKEKELDVVDVNEPKEKKTAQEEAEEKGIVFGLNLFAFEKWGKTQMINLFDFSSLNGVISTLKGIAVIVLAIQLFRKKK